MPTRLAFSNSITSSHRASVAPRPRSTDDTRYALLGARPLVEHAERRRLVERIAQPVSHRAQVPFRHLQLGYAHAHLSRELPLPRLEPRHATSLRDDCRFMCRHGLVTSVDRSPSPATA